MSRQGGINLTSKRPGGYRQNADAMVTIDACQLLSAIKNGLNFFHNEYSGLVFGVGKRKGDGNWDLEIPIRFFSIPSIKIKEVVFLPHVVKNKSYILFSQKV